MMYYNKPSDMRYVDMAIYIDNHIYNGDYDEELVMQCLYNLFRILAIKKRFFEKGQDYEDYALMSASNMYMRLTNSRQFLPDDDPKKLSKVVHVLNYIKSKLNHAKVDYQRKYYNEVTSQLDVFVNSGIHSQLVSSVNNANSHLMKVDFDCYIRDLPNTVRSFVNELPYSSDREMTNNIHTSILLSILKSMTLSYKNFVRLKKKEFKKSETVLYDRVFEEERDSSITLYGVDESMRGYISVLVKEVKKLIAKDMRYIVGSYELPDDIVRGALYSSKDVAINGDKSDD